MNNTRLRVVLVIVLAHAAVNVAHAAAHIAEEIALPPAANAFVVLVILLAPFLALGLLYTRRQRAGAWLLFGSMLGALLFGVVYHFVLVGPDNIMQAPDGSWGSTFQASALLLAVIELSGAVAAGWMLRSLRSP
jgi:amino acid permease